MNRITRALTPLLLLAAAACNKEKLCSSDLVLCDGQCTAIATDPANCGGCGQACEAGQLCSNRTCYCSVERADCGATCNDLESDAANCGACGNACAGALLCTKSDVGAISCASACAGTGQVACGRACVNLQTHRDNCGACGQACGSNERCSRGLCVADLYLACYNSDEVREATGALEAAGVPLAMAPGPIGLAWAGDLLAVGSARPGGAETLAMLHFDPPGVRRADVFDTSVANPDIEYVAEHAGFLYLSRASAGTMLVVSPGGTVIDEVALDAPDAENPKPQGIAFSGDVAYVALNASDEVLVLDVSGVSSCAAATRTPPCTSELARVNVHAVASPGAYAKPARIAVTGGRAYVALWNLDAGWNPPAGSTGRLAAINTSTLALDADFAGTTNGLIDLGPDCLNPADVAVHGGTLYVTCGAFDYSNWPAVTIQGSGIVPVDVSATVAQVLPAIAAGPDQAPGKLAFCGSTGYVGDRNSGRVFVFDPASGSTTLGAGVELCPPSNGFAYVADIACGR
jgi:hypothetical protein